MRSLRPVVRTRQRPALVTRRCSVSCTEPASGEPKLVALQVEDYDRDTGALTVRLGKGRKDRVCYAPAGRRAALHAWLAIRGEGPERLFCPVTKGGRVVLRSMSDQAILVHRTTTCRAARRQAVQSALFTPIRPSPRPARCRCRHRDGAEAGRPRAGQHHRAPPVVRSARGRPPTYFTCRSQPEPNRLVPERHRAADGNGGVARLR